MNKCPFCKEEFQTNDLDVHMQITHPNELEGSKKRLKIGLTFALVGFAIVIGMLWGEIV